MNKQVETRRGKKVFLLGQDQDGVKHWLEEGSWDCDWYWGFGYVVTYEANRSPATATDIRSMCHFDYLFFNRKHCCFDNFKEFFKETPLLDEEIWTLLELMKTFYTLKEAAAVMTRGGSHITTNPLGLVKDTAGAKKINAIVLPPLMHKVYELLTPETK